VRERTAAEELTIPAYVERLVRADQSAEEELTVFSSCGPRHDHASGHPATRGMACSTPTPDLKRLRVFIHAGRPRAGRTQGARESMTVNLHARDDFKEGDIGYVRGHHVNKATGPETQKGSNLVTALQEVKAGTNGWFEVR
jgi:hypothetical protein